MYKHLHNFLQPMCARQSPIAAPGIPSPGIHSLCNPAPDTFLTDRIWPKSRDVTYEIRKRFSVSPFLAFWHSLSFAHLDEASCHAVSCPVERSWRRSQASEDLDPASIHVSELGSPSTSSRFSRWLPSWLTPWLQPCWRQNPEPEAPVKLPLDSWLIESVR